MNDFFHIIIYIYTWQLLFSVTFKFIDDMKKVIVIGSLSYVGEFYSFLIADFTVFAAAFLLWDNVIKLYFCWTLYCYRYQANKNNTCEIEFGKFVFNGVGVYLNNSARHGKSSLHQLVPKARDLAGRFLYDRDCCTKGWGVSNFKPSIPLTAVKDQCFCFIIEAILNMSLIKFVIILNFLLQ